MEPFGQTYPATLEVDRADRVANWRPIVQWLLAIPHWAILNALQDLSGIIVISAGSSSCSPASSRRRWPTCNA